MKTWTINHKGHEIRVTNSVSGEALYIDNQLQDIGPGIALRSLLWGKITENGNQIEVKVRLGGSWRVKCWIFVDSVAVMIKGKPVQVGS
ncbi:MAG: hypothetical protein E4H13_06405 [Calditrichales bacterium]|nr:MAG: hypothetical protein E4H13_06405 [Calditrichales bacterium]